MYKLEYTKSKLLKEHHSLVICADCDTVISDGAGIKPLIQALEAVKNAADITAADKIVGKAAAFLYVEAGVRAVFGEVMSRSATELFGQYGVQYEYQILTDNIINRQGNGLCPMEKTVQNILEPSVAKKAILKKMQELSQKNSSDI